MDFFRNYNMFGMQNQEPYNKTLKCSSGMTLANSKGEEINKGGKIILPSSALVQLTQLNIQYPMLFKLTNPKTGRFGHCGVLEFIADEGRCILPYWMMDNLALEEFEIVKVEYVSLPTAKFAKFQPQSVDFLEITNPKAVLENALRSFATLTKEEIIQISYNKTDYRLKVLELKPSNAVSIIECDMDVDFAPPPGYQEPTYKKPEASQHQSAPKDYSKYIKKKETVPYAGEGYRLDGKVKKPDAAQASNVLKEKNEIEFQRGIPNYEYQIGTISFNRHPSKKAVPEDEKKKDQPKEITGRRLKDIK